MKLVGSITLDTKVLDKIAANLDKNSDDIVKGIAFEVKQSAQDYAPVDTGALKGSIKVKPIKKNLYHVHDGVHYGIYQEYGTSRMAAQPFMTPAIERVRKFIVNKFKGLIK